MFRQERIWGKFWSSFFKSLWVWATPTKTVFSFTSFSFVLKEKRQTRLTKKKAFVQYKTLPFARQRFTKDSNYLLWFSHCWLATPQEVLQADWQEVWHSPHPPFLTVASIFLVSIVLILLIVKSFAFIYKSFIVV